MVILPSIGNPYNGYITLLLGIGLIDDRPLTQGTNGSLDPWTLEGPFVVPHSISCSSWMGHSTSPADIAKPRQNVGFSVPAKETQKGPKKEQANKHYIIYQIHIKYPNFPCEVVA